MSKLTSRGRARVRRERARLEEEAEESTEINLVPYLDIVTNILLFLLVTITTMVTVGNIEVATPERSANVAGDKNDNPETPPLNLTLAITKSGFTVAGSGGVLYENGVQGKLPTVPKLSGNRYNYEALQKLLAKIKKQYPTEKQAILAAEQDIQYETIIGAMDVLRVGPDDELLFPQVLFSTGFQ